jgi:pimeloyl-ACP methyl ester carboxylesterase
MMMISFCAFAILIVAIVWTMWLLSPGVPPHLAGSDGRSPSISISEKLFVEINGIRQGMFIRGKDAGNPVLLFLHGGPAMPEFAISLSYPAVLEEHFVVCWWEQRGSGLSFRPNSPTDSITEEQLLFDTLAVSNYLRKRFKQDKIYLMAHSAGTFFGIQAASQAPELYYAYIGVGQISRQMDSEKLAYTYMLHQFSVTENHRMVEKLKAIPMLELIAMPSAYYSIRDKAMHRLGIGTTHAMRSVVKGIFVPVMLCRAYTFREKINLWRGKLSASSTNMWNEIIATDLTAKVKKLDIPVYFMSGKFDYTVSTSLSRNFLENIQAPTKGFYIFAHSAHSPMFEEPERFGQILKQDVLAGVATLADAVTAFPNDEGDSTY